MLAANDNLSADIAETEHSTVAIRCPKCQQQGSAFWTEVPAQNSAGQGRGRLVYLSGGFQRDRGPDDPREPMIVCEQCQTILPRLEVET